MLFILLIVSSFLAVDGGHLVFFSPFCSKSSVLTLPGLANELIQRGQKVTVVTSWPGLNFHPNVNQVLVDSGFSELNDQFSWMILSKNHTSLELFRVYNNLVGKSLKTAQVAITSEQLHKILASKKKKTLLGFVLTWRIVQEMFNSLSSTVSLSQGCKKGPDKKELPVFRLADSDRSYYFRNDSTWKVYVSTRSSKTIRRKKNTFLNPDRCCFSFQSSKHQFCIPLANRRMQAREKPFLFQ